MIIDIISRYADENYWAMCAQVSQADRAVEPNSEFHILTGASNVFCSAAHAWYNGKTVMLHCEPLTVAEKEDAATAITILFDKPEVQEIRMSTVKVERWEAKQANDARLK